MMDPQNVYIGRRGIVFIDNRRFPEKDSSWSNPFKVKKGVEGSREEAIRMYRDMILDRIASGQVSRKDFEQLQGKNLGCWCHPEPCHGDVLLDITQNLDKYF